MSTEDFVPPPIPPELLPPEEWYEPYLKFGLYVGAAFQLVCILALIFLPPGSKESGKTEGYLFEDESSSEEDEDEDDEDDVLNSHQRQQTPGAHQRQHNKKKTDKKKKRL